MANQAEDPYTYALLSNASWASYKTHQNPHFFPSLSTAQHPTILWLGCSDSRVPETTLLGLQPGDVFVHRNIANILSPTDINSSAVIEYAVVHLKVQHIVLCGHTGCGGAAAALAGGKVGGVLDTWLTPLKRIVREHKAELDAIKDEAARAVRLVELNVKQGVETVLANSVVEEAIVERGLRVHGVVYELGSGRIRELSAAGGSGNGKGMGEDIQIEEEFELVRGKHGVLLFSGDVAELAVR